ncbi:MAG: Lrp/AsnC family transcriptional regulator [Magnetococcales bacterium]|nr:Lrp/AsnC family transcriptional regulator [Magnetococcales bacterium]
MDGPSLTALDRQLLDQFQHQFPLTPHPYADIAAQIGSSEEAVLERLQQLQQNGVVSRVGVVINHRRVGASTLAAMAVPAEQLASVAARVTAYPEVNHNYEREHRLNLWFVVTATDPDHLARVIGAIEHDTGLSVLSMPMESDFHINLGFPLCWSLTDARPDRSSTTTG